MTSSVALFGYGRVVTSGVASQQLHGSVSTGIALESAQGKTTPTVL